MLIKEMYVNTLYRKKGMIKKYDNKILKIKNKHEQEK